MKLLLFITLVLFSITVNAQNVKINSDGNYVAVKTTAAKDAILVETGKTYTDSKGVVYPVCITKTKKFFVMKTSHKTGNPYKMYLKL